MAIDEENIIEMTDEDGNVVKCELFDIVEFDGKQYALLIEADSDEEEDESNPVFSDTQLRIFQNPLTSSKLSSSSS